MAEVCPAECRVELEHLGRAIDENKKSIKAVRDDVTTRAKVSTIITVSIIVIGVLSGLLSALYFQANAMDKKLDLVREHQVQVMTVLNLREIQLENHHKHDESIRE